MYSGIDISRWQGDIDFNAVRDAGYSFVIHKAGGSNAGVYTDSRYQIVVPKARAAGMRIGHYWFNGSSGTPAQGADHMVDNLSGYSHQDILVLDIETETDRLGRVITPRWNSGQALEFLKRVRSRIPGARLYIYMNQSDLAGDNWGAVKDFGVGLWIAAPGSSNPRTAPWPEWDIHQFTFTGRIPGYGGDLDLDYAKPRVWDDDEDGYTEIDRAEHRIILGSEARVELSLWQSKGYTEGINAKSTEALALVKDVYSITGNIHNEVK